MKLQNTNKPGDLWVYFIINTILLLLATLTFLFIPIKVFPDKFRNFIGCHRRYQSIPSSWRLYWYQDEYKNKYGTYGTFAQLRQKVKLSSSFDEGNEVYGYVRSMDNTVTQDKWEYTLVNVESPEARALMINQDGDIFEKPDSTGAGSWQWFGYVPGSEINSSLFVITVLGLLLILYWVMVISFEGLINAAKYNASLWWRILFFIQPAYLILCYILLPVYFG